MTRRAQDSDFVWTRHLLQRMRERRVTREQVLDALSSQDLPQVSKTTGNLCYRHTYADGRTLKVVVKAGLSTPRIIKTTAWEGEDD